MPSYSVTLFKKFLNYFHRRNNGNSWIALKELYKKTLWSIFDRIDQILKTWRWRFSRYKWFCHIRPVYQASPNQENDQWRSFYSQLISTTSRARVFFFYQASRDTIRCFEEIARLYSEKCKAKAQIDWPVDESTARNSYDSAKTRYNETDSQYFKL